MKKQGRKRGRSVTAYILAAILIIGIGAFTLLLYFRGHIGSKQTQLFNAAYAGNWRHFSKLVRSYNEFDSMDSYGQTLLILACYQPDEKIVILMISQGADVNMQEKSRTGSLPLHCAVEAEHVNIANILLENRADINAKSNYGWTPLHVACNNLSVKMIKFLLKNGADVNARNNGGWTPLHQALKSPERTKREVVELLITYGADINANNPDGSYYDSQHDSHTFRKAPVYSGDTPLSIAVSIGYEDIADLLKSHGAKE